MLSREQKRPNAELLLARRILEELNSVEILEDLKWDPLFDKWVLLCRISSESKGNDLIPKYSNWYVLIEDGYPWGEIKFYPAKKSGLKGTFPHQNYNGDEHSKHPWTGGNLCLDSSYKPLRHLGLDSEPFDSEYRLLWHFERALSWLKGAAEGTLSKDGDPFELPHFKNNLNTVVFYEDSESFLGWQKSRANYGLAELLFYKEDEPFVIVPMKYSTTNGNEVYKPKWGTEISNLATESQTLVGAWLILKELPVVPPWQAPTTWGELMTACTAQGINLKRILKNLSTKLRDGKHHIILIGFPIPEKINNNHVQVHWQPLQLPTLSNVKVKIKGFRDTEKFNWFQDLKGTFKTNNKIQWLNSENWHDGELFNRGRLNSIIRESSILQLGAGAVGSTISELLVRSGQKEITIMDDDLLEAGNIVRNTLTSKDVLQFKIDKLKDRLNNISPHSKVQGVREKFPPKNKQSVNIQSYDVILDCTGEDQTLYNLSKLTFEEPKTFLSISLGYQARRLFVFYSNGIEFNHTAFIKLMQPWLAKEKEDTKHIEFPREGIGCWHPVFPARADDIWLMVSSAFKTIERAILTTNIKPTILVYEQQWNGDLFKGISLIHQEEYNE